MPSAAVCCLGFRGYIPGVGKNASQTPQAPVWNDLTCALTLAHDLAHLLATQSPDKPGDDHLRLGLRRLGDSVLQLLRLLSRQEHLLGPWPSWPVWGDRLPGESASPCGSAMNGRCRGDAIEWGRDVCSELTRAADGAVRLGNTLFVRSPAAPTLLVCCEANLQVASSATLWTNE
jgi:hypothetical protein